MIRREAIEFDDKGYTLSYREVKTYEFMPEASTTDSLNSTVVVPNLPYFVSTRAYPVESSSGTLSKFEVFGCRISLPMSL